MEGGLVVPAHVSSQSTSERFPAAGLPWPNSGLAPLDFSNPRVPTRHARRQTRPIDPNVRDHTRHARDRTIGGENTGIVLMRQGRWESSGEECTGNEVDVSLAHGPEPFACPKATLTRPLFVPADGLSRIQPLFTSQFVQQTFLRAFESSRIPVVSLALISMPTSSFRAMAALILSNRGV